MADDTLISPQEISILILGAIIIMSMTTIMVAGGAITDDPDAQELPNASELTFSDPIVTSDAIPSRPNQPNEYQTGFSEDLSDSYEIDRRRYVDSGGDRMTGSVLTTAYWSYTQDVAIILINDQTAENGVTKINPYDEGETKIVTVSPNEVSGSQRDEDYRFEVTLNNVDHDTGEITWTVEVLQEPEHEWDPDDDEDGILSGLTAVIDAIATVITTIVNWIVWIILAVGAAILVLFSWIIIFVEFTIRAFMWAMDMVIWIITGWTLIAQWAFDVHALIGGVMTILAVTYGIISGRIVLRIIRYLRDLLKL